MYDTYFGFADKPFALTPNTKFLYLSEQHDAALKLLEYGVNNRTGFMMLSGEVGSGKTTTVRALLRRVAETVETAVVLNPMVSPLDLVRGINLDFGVMCASDSLQDQITAFNQFLFKTHERGRTALVIIDEAQNLSFELFEMVRMLSNLETESEKLVQILLVGQPELIDKIEDVRLRQLAQRIQIRAQLKPLTLLQTSGYIRHRLLRAAPKVPVHFDDAAIKSIYKTARGIPRIINSICELGLVAAYAENTTTVDKKLIKRVLKEIPIYVGHS